MFSILYYTWNIYNYKQMFHYSMWMDYVYCLLDFLQHVEYFNIHFEDIFFSKSEQIYYTTNLYTT